MFDFKNAPLIVEAKNSKSRFSATALLIAVFVIFYLSQIFSSVPVGLVAAIANYDEMQLLINEDGTLNISNEEWVDTLVGFVTDTPALLTSLFATASAILLSVIFAKGIEKRSWRSFGFVGRRCVLRYLLGFFVGFLVFALAFAVSFLTKAVTVTVNSDVNVTIIILFFFGFLIQGASEEILMRGVFMLGAARTSSLGFAVAISSFAFAALHMSNTGISILAFLNLFLFGVFASLYMIRSGSIFGVCALHSAWNFAQGNIFGIRVSGMDVSHSLLQSQINYDRALTNGGEFGAEGGVAVTLVLLIAIMLVVYLPQKKKETQVK